MRSFNFFSKKAKQHKLNASCNNHDTWSIANNASSSNCNLSLQKNTSIKTDSSSSKIHDTLYKNATTIACVAGSVGAFIKFFETTKKTNTKIAFFQASLHGTGVAIKEGMKYIITTKINQVFVKKTITQSTTAYASPSRFYTNNILNFGVQLVFSSAGDMIKYKNGEISKTECLRRIKNNAGGIIGSMVVARGCMILGGMLTPVGAIALGIAGGYIGAYVGKKIFSTL